MILVLQCCVNTFVCHHAQAVKRDEGTRRASWSSVFAIEQLRRHVEAPFVCVCVCVWRSMLTSSLLCTHNIFRYQLHLAEMAFARPRHHIVLQRSSRVTWYISIVIRPPFFRLYPNNKASLKWVCRRACGFYKVLQMGRWTVTEAVGRECVALLTPAIIYDNQSVSIWKSDERCLGRVHKLQEIHGIHRHPAQHYSLMKEQNEKMCWLCVALLF